MVSAFPVWQEGHLADHSGVYGPEGESETEENRRGLIWLTGSNRL